MREMDKEPAAKKPTAKKSEAKPLLQDCLVTANKEILKKPLNKYGKSHISAIDRNTDIVWFKAADAPLKTENLIGVYLWNGRRTHERGTLPLDIRIHLALYKRYPQINSIAHVYPPNATPFSQAGADIPVMTADHRPEFGDSIRCCAGMYEGDTDPTCRLREAAMAEVLEEGSVVTSGGLLLHHDGALVWSMSPRETIETAMRLETAAQAAWSRVMQERKTKVFGNEDAG